MHNHANGFTFKARVKSIGHAIDGLIEMLKAQHNAWIHLGASAVVIVAGIFFQVAKLEWCLLILAISSVWVAEALNTALEILCDVAAPEFHPLIKKSKDIAAGAVLLAAMGAAIIGLIIFLPYLKL